jgi:formiminotetrahydrofolate cyclodeaminase
MAAELVVGVVGQTLGKPKYAEVETEMKSIRERVEKLRAELIAAIAEEVQANEKITAAFKLSGSEKARHEKIEHAAVEALQVPLGVARKAVDVMALAERCALVGNLSAIADAAAAVSLARGALIAAGYNIRINVDALQKKVHGEGCLFEVDALEARAARINRQARHVLRERAGLKLE